MSDKHPELLFLAGPQAQQRMVLDKPLMVLGRSGEADVVLGEAYVSRQQARYELLKAGPTLENLSGKGTWINGRRFKAGKQVLLETGDLIGAGNETQILFVAAGDDPDEALARFKPEARGRDAFGQRVAPPPPAAAPVSEPPDAGEPEPQAEPLEAEEAKPAKPRARRPSEMTAGQRAELERKARQKKILIALGVWWGAMGLLAVLAWVFVKSKPPTDEVAARVLSEVEIRRHLEERLKPRTVSREMEELWLNRALRWHAERGFDRWKMHETVDAFKKSLAYSGRITFADPEHQETYRQVLDRFVQVVTADYRDACLKEKDKNWEQAKVLFERLLSEIGYETNQSPLFRNVQEHLARVKYYYQKEAKADRGPGLMGR